jgi:hypothetical protein
MNMITVELQCNEHCIETAAREKYRSLLDHYMEQWDNDPVEGKQIELLISFLETADFNFLRSSDERLAGVVPSVVTLSRLEDGAIDFKIRE